MKINRLTATVQSAARKPLLAVTAMLVVVASPATLLAKTQTTADVRITSKGVSLDCTPTGEASIVVPRESGSDLRAPALTSLAGCRPNGPVTLHRPTNQSLELTRTWIEPNGPDSCIVVDRFSATENGIRWDVELRGAARSWSAPIETHLLWPEPNEAMFWTAWSDPLGARGTWHDPLVLRPVETRRWWYGAPYFKEDRTLIGYCPFEGDTVCIPMATLIDTRRDTGLSLLLSPDDALLDLTLSTERTGKIVFSRIHHRISSARPVRFGMDLITHRADWRGGLNWMTRRYPAFFRPANLRAFELAGCGAYSSFEGDLDVEKCLRMSFRLNWKASYDFPYMGMFIPPVQRDTDKYPRFMNEGNRPYTTIRQMADYSHRMRSCGFSVLSYFNVTEFGTDLKGPEAIGQSQRTDDLWKNANNFLYTQIPDGVLRGIDGKTWGTWGGAIAMDPGDAKYQAFLLEQARRHITCIPESDGICIDRLDWLRFYNPNADDGLAWRIGHPMRSLFTSWRDLMTRLGPLMHEANKVIFVNNHLKRLDLLRNIDGIYCEFAQVGTALNGTGLLCVVRPAIGWTADENDLKPDPDALFQRHLHMGVYPTAPLPHNDHTINPSALADRFYLDYGPLLDAIRGRQWVLQDHVVEVVGDLAKANVFSVPGGFAIPVTFGGKAAEVELVLQHLPRTPEVGRYRAEVIHPGRGEWRPLPQVAYSDRIAIRVPLVRGCAMLRLSYAWIDPRRPFFHVSQSVTMGTLIGEAVCRYTLDGADPKPNSEIYRSPLHLTKTTTVRATVFHGERRLDDVMTQTFVKAPPSAPILTPGGAAGRRIPFEEAVSVAIESPYAKAADGPSAGTIRYTLNDYEPQPTSARYEQPIRLTRDATIKARVFIDGAEPGCISSGTFMKVPPIPPEPKVHLSDLRPLKASVGWGDRPRNDRSIQGNPLRVCGKTYPRGIGVHARSELVYALKPSYRTFVAVVGPDDEMLSYDQQSVVFEVYADSRCLGASPVLRRSERWSFNIAIPAGAQSLRLLVTDAGDGINCDHADWAMAGFLE